MARKSARPKQRMDMTIALPARPLKDEKHRCIYFNHVRYLIPKDKPHLLDALYDDMCRVVESRDGNKLIELLRRIKPYRAGKKIVGGREPNRVVTEEEYARKKLEDKKGELLHEEKLSELRKQSAQEEDE